MISIVRLPSFAVVICDTDRITDRSSYQLSTSMVGLLQCQRFSRDQNISFPSTFAQKSLPRVFIDLPYLHRDSLGEPVPSLVKLLELEVKGFRRVTNSGRESAYDFNDRSKILHELFKRIWLSFRKRFSSLMAFCGGLSIEFSGEAAVEADFKIFLLNWREYSPFVSKMSVQRVFYCR